MISVKFWNFDKKINSTKIPTNTGAQEFSCALKDNCSVLSPRIALTGAANFKPINYNYAYIADFSRYYFVGDWEWERGEWVTTLSNDPLASHKTAIGNLTKYVLRSASAGNGNLIDNMFPTTGKTTTIVNAVENPFSATSLSQGCYILNAIGDESPLFLCVAPGDWDRFWHAIFTNGRYTDWLDVGGGDLSSFVKSCFWVPFAPAGVGAGIVSIGPVWLDDVAYVTKITSPVIIKTATVALPKHPQAAAHGNYLNSGGFSSYHLNLVPFGSIEIPADRLFDVSALTIVYRSDYTTGEVVINIVDDNGYGVTTMTGNVAVPVEFGRSVTKTMLGAAVSVAPAGVAAGLQIASGNYVGGLMTAAGALISGARAMTPLPVSGGSQGSIAGLAFTQYLTAQFSVVADTDWTDLGRPLCASVVLNTLSGYIQCADGEVPFSCYESEKTAISSFLTGGFFYE